jgi:hypothetical protein
MKQKSKFTTQIYALSLFLFSYNSARMPIYNLNSICNSFFIAASGYRTPR